LVTIVSLKKGTLYLILSHVKCLIDLQVLEPLSQIILQYFQLGNVHIVEETSLQALEKINLVKVINFSFIVMLNYMKI
jgi:hypothetical protein